MSEPAAAMSLGIDPGPKSSGWALIDFSIPSAPVWFDGGNTERLDALFELLRQRGLAQLVRLVAVEQPRGRVQPERATQVLATAWEGGRALGFAEALGFRVVAVGAHEWRQALVGNSRAGDDVDAKVKQALRSLVRHFPERSNVHVRDAAGAACVATRDWRHALRLAQQARTLEEIRR